MLEKRCHKIMCKTEGGVEGGLIVRLMNGDRGTGDMSGQTLMDSVPAGGDASIDYEVLTRLLLETV